MAEEFEDQTYKEISYRNISGDGNLIKSKDATVKGLIKIFKSDFY